MTWKYAFLVFADRAEWENKAVEAGARWETQPDGENVLVYPYGWAVDEIGQNMTEAVIDTSGIDPIVTTPAEPKDGWLVNIAVNKPIPAVLEPFMVHPESPKRVFEQ